MNRGQTIAEKILSRHSGKDARAGEQVVASVTTLMSHEAWRVVGSILEECGVRKLWDKDKVILILDHGVPAPDARTANSHALVRRLAAKYEVKDEHFYDVRGGISHQVMCERGHVRPGDLTVGTDSHSTMYGALGAAGVAVGFTEGAYVATTGKLWFLVPETISIHLDGAFLPGVTSKDLVLYLCGRYGSDMAQYKAIEYRGPASSAMSVESRMTVANMGAELGAKFAFFAPDEKTKAYLEAAGAGPYEPVTADEDATYTQKIEIDVSGLEPQVACPHNVENVKPVSQVDRAINQAYLGSCTNARIEDLRAAAKLLAGRQVARGVRLLVSPASQKVYAAAAREGLLETFVEAGAVILNPGCGPCFGAHLGLMGDKEVCISSSNRNFQGRMGSAEAEVYLGSPLTVAASALTGKITDPRQFMGEGDAVSR